MKIEAYLRPFTWDNGDIKLECHVDFSEGDKSVGLGCSACLCYAFIGETEISEYLAPAVIKQIEDDACFYFSER